MARLLHHARQLGPYALAALLLPGGVVLVPLAWLYRNRSRLKLPFTATD